MGQRTLSSRLVKSFNVEIRNNPKVVGIPAVEPKEEENQAAAEKEYGCDIELELQKQLEEYRNEFEEWKKREEELFLVQLEEEKRKGYQEGYQLGVEDGKNDGKRQYVSELQKAAEILEQAFQQKAEIIEEAEPFVLELTIEIARKVLQQELKTNPEALINLIKGTLADVYETETVSIGVAPEDFSYVQKQRKQLLAPENGQIEVKVFPDYSIDEGGCIIRTSSGSIDARIDMQLGEIKKALLSFQKEVTGE
ncbi:hypothetical protein D1B31_20545 [Neobacillus notoginsengisoli]|uniref:Flagellar assembly protein FliH/Type III secretion system HrpE domain-containing protein n=1 Tax=Neobacillus notoginsengisoli TaxID=1578198 RepID=A0A417YJL5_9BACI|nr:FliH/SctL family protein [Neobacillus notoginsengisoli]RHW33307.1 hypothetical protein D1B31_20545 [Neobacillus notoginsengisoli]